MITVNLPTAKDVCEHMAIRLNQSVMLWGQPGVGKSEIVQQLADEIGAYLIDFRCGQPFIAVPTIIGIR